MEEKITKKQLMAMFIMLLGLGLLEYDDLPRDIRFDDILVLTATIPWAIEKHYR